jgi:50S ribosomal protein L16 3-hydroxylase
MDIDKPSGLLGGLSPSAFMRRHWQKKPLLVRQALPGIVPPATRHDLFALAARDDVESRLVVRGEGGWRLRHGPLPRRALPPLHQPGWTVLVQGVDLQRAEASALIERFRFIPDARLDDLMISWASDGGGVGPHLDSYDVFLVQVQGRRRWRIGRCPDDRLVEGVPLKILRHFEPQREWVLEPGDLLYLPPRWAHDGIAEGECMTASVGFRAPARATLAAELLARLSDALTSQGSDAGPEGALYRDPAQTATPSPGRIPAPLQDFARSALQAALRDPRALECALGEALTEPKPRVWFPPGPAGRAEGDVRLDERTRMLYDRHHVFINGESFRASGRDARLMQRLADGRSLTADEREALSAPAQALMTEWLQAGWLRMTDDL